MPQLGRQVARERAARLRAKGDAALAAHFASLVGSAKEILLEKGGIGRTECFAPVRFDGVAGRFVTVALTGTESGQLVGQRTA
jgi:threonylcarbamoyladenosine tRNA methylthiotransferase MtaB